MIIAIQETTELKEFNDKIWMMTVDVVRIKPDGKMQFGFRNGSTIEI